MVTARKINKRHRYQQSRRRIKKRQQRKFYGGLLSMKGSVRVEPTTTTTNNELPIPPPPESFSKIDTSLALKELDDQVLEYENPNADSEIMKRFKVMDCKEIRAYIDKTKFTEEEKIKFIRQHTKTSTMLQDYIKKQHWGDKEIELVVDSGKFILDTVKEKFQGIIDWVLSEEEDLQKNPDCKVLLDMVDAYDEKQRNAKKTKSKTPRNRWSATKRRLKKFGVAAMDKAKYVSKKAYNGVSKVMDVGKKTVVGLYVLIKWIIKKGWAIWTYINNNPGLVLLTVILVERLKNHLCFVMGKTMGHITYANIGEHWNTLVTNVPFLPEAVRKKLLTEVNVADPKQNTYMWNWFQDFSKNGARNYVVQNGETMIKETFEPLQKNIPEMVKNLLTFTIPFTGVTSIQLASGVSFLFSVIIEATQVSVTQSIILSAHMQGVNAIFNKLFDIVNPSKCIPMMAKTSLDTYDTLDGEQKISSYTDTFDANDTAVWRKETPENFTSLPIEERLKIEKTFKEQNTLRRKVLKYIDDDFDYVDVERLQKQGLYNQVIMEKGLPNGFKDLNFTELFQNVNQYLQITEADINQLKFQGDSSIPTLPFNFDEKEFPKSNDYMVAKFQKKFNIPNFKLKEKQLKTLNNLFALNKNWIRLLGEFEESFAKDFNNNNSSRHEFWLGTNYDTYMQNELDKHTLNLIQKYEKFKEDVDDKNFPTTREFKLSLLNYLYDIIGCPKGDFNDIIDDETSLRERITALNWYLSDKNYWVIGNRDIYLRFKEINKEKLNRIRLKQEEKDKENSRVQEQEKKENDREKLRLRQLAQEKKEKINKLEGNIRGITYQINEKQSHLQEYKNNNMKRIEDLKNDPTKQLEVAEEIKIYEQHVQQEIENLKKERRNLEDELDELDK